MFSIDSAESFLWLNARLLERLRFDHLFRSGDARRVVEALRPYQNPDGGFGHGLEPDLRGPDSQPIPVDVALFVIHEAGERDSDMMPGILDFLTVITGPDGGVPFVLPTAVRSPRGPWWQPSPGNPSALNPTGALAASLYRLGVHHPWIDGATQFCWDQIEGLTETSPYEMRAMLAFLEEVPDRARADAAWDRIGPMMLPHIALEPGAQGDVHPPLAFAPRPDSLARRLFSDDLIDAHLDALEAAQQPDGGWGFGFESWTPITTPEWRGWVTVESLITLRDNGRV
jgi:hypothetical protein